MISTSLGTRSSRCGKERLVIHFTCDLCGKRLNAGEDSRFVVKVEVYAAYDPMEITSEEMEEDRQEEIGDLLDEMADMEAEDLEDQVYKAFRYDLCAECHAAYLKDPLGKSVGLRARFGHN
jgi:hypothetical protein